MASNLSQRQALVVLNGLSHVGPVLLRRLMEAFDGDAVRVLSAPEKDLRSVQGIGPKAAESLSRWERHFDLAKEEAAMEKAGCRFFTSEDGEFPALLGETFDPPIGLYWKGGYVIDRPCLAIVGTRRSTLYGRAVTRKFAGELARLGFCVVSGMARGTDTAAHEGALEAGGKTVAVLGCGLDIIYPPENLDLYKRIVAEGAVVSEFPFGRRADRQTFPMRNRLVAGMCQGLVVVESDVAGGSMITARFAGEQGRPVMAVPGRIDQASSAGCHQLIRDGATMVTSVDDILEELRYTRIPGPDSETNATENGNKGAEDRKSPSAADLSDLEKSVLERLQGGEIASPDRLAEALERPMAEVAALLMGLELKHLVVKRADGCFEAR